MPLPGKEGKLFKRPKVRFFFSQNQPFSTISLSQSIRKPDFFRTSAKYQVDTETGGVRSAEIRCSLNQISTNPYSNGSEPMPTDGDAAKPTAITTTYIPHTSPITLRITQRTNRIKSYERIPTRST
jgi:hypothetical protein